MFKNTASRYGLVSKLFHWVAALLIIGLIWAGWYLVNTEFSYYDRFGPQLLAWHEQLGIVVLMLAVLKLGWQAYSPRPGPAAAIGGWQRYAAAAMHRLLGLMMILIPVTGYLFSTSDGRPLDFFGLFQIPAAVSGHPAFRDFCIKLHEYCAYGALALIIGHAGAALKHQFVNRDGTLARMLWR